MQPCCPSGIECPTQLLAAALCSWQLGPHGSSLLSDWWMKSCSRMEAVVAQDTSSYAPAVLCPARSSSPCPTQQEALHCPGRRRHLSPSILRVQVASLVCRTVVLQEQAQRNTECLQAPKGRQLALCDQYLARPLGHKPPALTPCCSPPCTCSTICPHCGRLWDAVVLYQGHGALPRLPSSLQHRTEGGRSLQKGVIFERLKSSLTQAIRECVGSRSPGQSSRKRGGNVELGDLKSNEKPVKEPLSFMVP